MVGDPDFVFSTPLGIVSRKNEVGEIWLYVPHGTVKLTIKHPRWGVLRDYRFPAALESRLTYELVIASPPEKVQEKPYPEVLKRPFRGLKNTSLDCSLRPVSGESCGGRKAGLFSLGNLGVTRGEVANGLRFGIMKRHGGWLHVQSNFRFLSTSGKCNKAGSCSLVNRHLITRVPCPGFKYGDRGRNSPGDRFVTRLRGIGYGEQQVVWETLEGVKLQNTDYSEKDSQEKWGYLWMCVGWRFLLGVDDSG